MARVNIEPELFNDRRFMKLVIALGGDEERALGALIRVWVIGQRFWKMNRHGIPKPEWQKQELNAAVIQVGLAEDRGEFVYVTGSHKHFDWLLARQEAGRKGAAKTNEKLHGNAAANDGKSRPLTLTLTLTPSPSPSPSLAPALTQKKERTKNKKRLPGGSKTPPGTEHDFFAPTVFENEAVQPFPRQPAKTAALWEAYADAYYFRYQTEPLRNATVNGQLSNLLARLGTSAAPHVIRHYVESNNAYYVKNRHTVGLLVKDAEKLHTDWKLGASLTDGQARTVDRNQTNDDSWDQAYETLQRAEARAKE